MMMRTVTIGITDNITIILLVKCGGNNHLLVELISCQYRAQHGFPTSYNLFTEEKEYRARHTEKTQTQRRENSHQTPAR